MHHCKFVAKHLPTRLGVTKHQCKCGTTKIFKKKERLMKGDWFEALKLLLPVSNRIMLVGPPGVGKSRTAADLLGKAQRITMTEGTGIEDLIGMFHLRKGETIWVDGPASTAMRQGHGLVIDEIDKHSPEVGSLLYALLDDDPQITLPTGEHLKAAKGYQVVATSNANITVLPEAIIDRMEAVLLAMKPHPDAMTTLSDPQKAAVENFYRNIPDTAWQWTGVVTLRRMRAFAKLRKSSADEAIVATAVFGKSGKEVLGVLATSSR